MQYPDSTKLQAEVDEFMAKFDEKREQVQNILISNNISVFFYCNCFIVVSVVVM